MSGLEDADWDLLGVTQESLREHMRLARGLEQQLDTKTCELDELQAKHLQQIKDRIPIFMAEKVSSWPELLTAVSRLKQDRNNLEIELEASQTHNSELRQFIRLADNSMGDGEGIGITHYMDNKSHAAVTLEKIIREVL